MTRFVVVATANRGVVDPPEVLDDANQWRAFSAWREEASRGARVEFELAQDDAAVVWGIGSGLHVPKKRVSRDRRAAEYWAKKAGA